MFHHTKLGNSVIRFVAGLPIREAMGHNSKEIDRTTTIHKVFMVFCG